MLTGSSLLGVESVRHKDLGFRLAHLCTSALEHVKLHVGFTFGTPSRNIGALFARRMTLNAFSFNKHTDLGRASVDAVVVEEIRPVAFLFAARTRVEFLLACQAVLFARDTKVLA